VTTAEQRSALTSISERRAVSCGGVLRRVASFLLLAVSASAATSPMPNSSADPSTPVSGLSPLVPGGGSIAVADWEARRREVQTAWQQVLGPWPSEKVPLQPEILATEELPTFTRQHVRYQVEPGVTTDGYLLTPRGLKGRGPAVVVFHQTTKTQAKQVAGIDDSNPELMHGQQLVERGYVVFCPRCFIFAEGSDYAGHVTAMQRTHPTRTGLARMTWDAMRAMDFLLTQPNVDPQRVGGLGHSLGAKEVLYAAAFDPRYRAVVFSEGGIGLGFSNWEARWYLGPQIKTPGFPREHHELLALIAPRGFLLLAGDSADNDRSRSYLDAVRPIYRAYGAEAQLGWLNHRTGHRYPPAAQSTAEDFLAAQLK
jgi:dienelactone hydrolase